MDLFGEIIQKTFLTEGIATVSTINDAINNCTPVEIRYTPVDKNNKATGRRIIYPVAYGLTKAGNPVVRAFEPYGDTHTHVPAWKFFLLDGLRQWRPLTKKTFKGEKLEGFNKDGDLSMSVVYNIANIEGKHKQFKPTTVKTGAITKTDVDPEEKETEIKQETNPQKIYTSKEIIDNMLKSVEDNGAQVQASQQADDMLSGIKSQLTDKEKVMVSPKAMSEIEKSNARRQLAIARKKGIKLDNETELLNIIKGKVATKTTAPQTKPITKKDIIDNGEESVNTPPQNIPTKAVYRKDVDEPTYEISQNDIDRIKSSWGQK